MYRQNLMPKRSGVSVLIQNVLTRPRIKIPRKVDVGKNTPPKSRPLARGAQGRGNLIARGGGGGVQNLLLRDGTKSTALRIAKNFPTGAHLKVFVSHVRVTYIRTNVRMYVRYVHTYVHAQYFVEDWIELAIFPWLAKL